MIPPNSEQKSWKEKNNCSKYFISTVYVSASYTQYDNKCEILLTALYWIHCITAQVINPVTAVQRVYLLYINIYNVAVLFILSAFIMLSEGHFGISYNMDFLSFSFFPIYCHSSFPSRLCFYTLERAFYLWHYLTQRACFLIIFSSLHWHWFMRVCLTHTPRPACSTNRCAVVIAFLLLYSAEVVVVVVVFLYSISRIFFLCLSDSQFLSLHFCFIISVFVLSLILHGDHLG